MITKESLKRALDMLPKPTEQHINHGTGYKLIVPSFLPEQHIGFEEVVNANKVELCFIYNDLKKDWILISID